jgi:transcriptional regulator with XRE-family HTH domain
VINLHSNYSVGKRLFDLRKNRGFSQEQLALEACITTSYIGQVERDERNVTVHTLAKICDALNISLSDFFSGSEIKNPAAFDEVSNQILYQLKGKTPEEKQAVLRMVKLVFSVQRMK